MQNDILVIAEVSRKKLTQETLECAQEGREIADGLKTHLHCLLPGSNDERLETILVDHGADKVTRLISDEMAAFSADGWLAAIKPIVQELRPILLLAPDTSHTRTWLPRLALRLDAPMVPDCIRVSYAGSQKLEFIRPIYGDHVHERLTYGLSGVGPTIMAMLRPGVRGIGPPAKHPDAQVRDYEPTLNRSLFRDVTLETLLPNPRTVDISDANVIVAGGSGMKTERALELLQQLAESLGGSIGCTRPVVDRNWLPAERMIGISGKIVAPELYLALGLSGASQHLGGVMSSENVIAINSDRNAPIFAIADIGLIGDLHLIVPEILIALDKCKNIHQRDENG